MMAVYYIAVKVVGGPPFHDWWADVLMGSELADLATKGLEVIGTSEWLTSLVVDGIVAGVVLAFGCNTRIIACYFGRYRIYVKNCIYIR